MAGPATVHRIGRSRACLYNDMVVVQKNRLHLIVSLPSLPSLRAWPGEQRSHACLRYAGHVSILSWTPCTVHRIIMPMCYAPSRRQRTYGPPGERIDTAVQPQCYRGA
eukprot:COSAG06_NODE_2389_length_6965_cov_6.611273_8_plen_108_part_00